MASATPFIDKNAINTCWRRGKTALLALLLTVSVTVSATDGLPSMAGAGGGLVSGQQERAIAEQVMVALRRSAPLLEDPLMLDYLTDVTYRLVPNAELDDRNLTLIILDEPQLNAFAVPGGLIGINAGLFSYAETEHQFASVIAHEIAHLSQRHYSRRMEQQQRDTPFTVAALVAGILLAAATGSDAGIAAIAGTQAIAIDNMLRYSRFHEQEADRVGIEMMHRSGFDPRGMPDMFSQMQRSAGSRPPEYLSTHPLTESRVADSRNRAEQLISDGDENRGENLEYHLMRARVIVRYSDTPANAAERFQRQAQNSSGNARLAARYGVAHALQHSRMHDRAEAIFRELLEESEGRITFVVGLAETLIDQEQLADAQELLEAHVSRNPGNLPLTRTLADTLVKLDKPQQAARHYERLLRDHPQDASLWDALADAQGRARNIVAVHRARGEKAILMGEYQAAIRQFQQAIERTGDDYTSQEILRQRLAQAQEESNRRRPRVR
ncbi:MAG: M48 family peptidase [Halomonadaceae bacterium]|nr:MAG: M48 family peptidase [Halomonadaceae bacterium]